jgi:hypothetical protein
MRRLLTLFEIRKRIDAARAARQSMAAAELIKDSSRGSRGKKKCILNHFGTLSFFVLLPNFSHVNRAALRSCETPTEKGQARRRCKTNDGAVPPLSFSDKI